jgi:quercetin dioxygenase-like cupin family protein
MRITLASIALLALGAATLHAQDSTATKKPELKWGPAPPVFPKGATMAVVSGDPSKAEMFTIQLSMPDGYKIAPHFHPTDESVEVLKGTFLVGMGDTLDVSKAKTMKEGEKGSIAANMHHYGTAKGATVLSVTAMGPFVLTYVNPADDPQKTP